MDYDGFAVQGRKRGGRLRESGRDRDLDSFHRDNARYAGTEHDFTRDHARSYGRHEGLGLDGSHPGPGKPHFPKGSDRERIHAGYTVSTGATRAARRDYSINLGAANKEFNKMTPEEIEYYHQVSDSLRPDQHERLDPRAGKWADSSYNMATGRENFLKAYPHGYHSLKEQNQHYDHAEAAFREYGTASGHQARHSAHRSFRGDPRRDQYGRPVPHGQL